MIRVHCAPDETSGCTPAAGDAAFDCGCESRGKEARNEQGLVDGVPSTCTTRMYHRKL